MYIPTEKAFINLTPTEFEKNSLDILREQTKNLENVVIEHNKIMKTFDGNYQIDGYIEFRVMGVTYKTLVECKHYKNSIPREKIQVLHGKLQSLGAQKGILISSSNFQSGAMDYAKKHGIALIQLTESETMYEMREHINMNMITANIRKPFNYEKPYSGVLVGRGDVGITCSYLSRSTLGLENFLLTN
ncbi:restriction endonuclease [Carnobacterium maltaromaticum]|uniref:restriction endonuclease n=1 Tax=Carnobacterium maltaromaticum TaxID=2751 RepID=UPI00295EE7AF|nr:restriction endonuclease [Carnobacterium maltaromaticum]